MFRSKLAALAVFAAAGVCSAQVLGSIRVLVLDGRQLPLEGAWVTAHHAGEFEDMWPGQCTTGSDGTCTMTIQGPGRFALQASKWQEAYPEKSIFYFGKGFPEDIVTLTQSNSSAAAVLHLDPKAGVIKGKVFDAATGKAIVGEVEFHWVSDPENWMSTGLSEIGFPVLVPANVPLTMLVSREGYQDWHYRDPDGAEKQLLLRPGETLDLDIHLRPKH